MEGVVSGVRLDYRDAGGGLSKKRRTNVMRDEIECLIECPQSSRESVFVSPTCPATVEQRIVVIGPVVIVVSSEEQALRRYIVSFVNSPSSDLRKQPIDMPSSACACSIRFGHFLRFCPEADPGPFRCRYRR